MPSFQRPLPGSKGRTAGRLHVPPRPQERPRAPEAGTRGGESGGNSDGIYFRATRNRSVPDWARTAVPRRAVTSQKIVFPGTN
jgi:hypothetical protein